MPPKHQTTVAPDGRATSATKLALTRDQDASEIEDLFGSDMDSALAEPESPATTAPKAAPSRPPAGKKTTAAASASAKGKKQAAATAARDNSRTASRDDDEADGPHARRNTDDGRDGRARIPPELLTRVLHGLFSKEGTRMTRDANSAVGFYVDIFVREAIARAATVRDGGFLEVEDLEKITPQLMLDL